jgi:hypothetical protein
MKVNDLKKIIKESVREAIQEEIKDILIEAVRAPKQVVQETVQPVTQNKQPQQQTSQQPLPESEKMKLRENMMSVLDGMKPGANGTMSATTNSIPLQVNGIIDTSSPNGQLPQGEVSMNQIMGLMGGK